MPPLRSWHHPPMLPFYERPHRGLMSTTIDDMDINVRLLVSSITIYHAVALICHFAIAQSKENLQLRWPYTRERGNGAYGI